MKPIKKEVKKVVKKVAVMDRLNTRIRPAQKEYIKKVAERDNLTEGEVFRAMIDEYIKKHK
jgi:hypothetical protein